MDNNTILKLYLNANENLILKEVNDNKETRGIGLLIVDVSNITRSHGWSCNTNTTFYTIDEIPGEYYSYKEQIANDPENSNSLYFLINLSGMHTFYKRLQVS